MLLALGSLALGGALLLSALGIGINPGWPCRWWWWVSAWSSCGARPTTTPARALADRDRDPPALRRDPSPGGVGIALVVIGGARSWSGRST